MKKFLFLLVFVVSACFTAMAIPSVDFVSTTTTLQGVVETSKAMGLYMPVGVACSVIIAVMQLLKYFFPKIDGR